MSVFSTPNYLPPGKQWENPSLSASHHKTFSYLHKPLLSPPASSYAYINLRNKLVSVDLSHSSKKKDPELNLSLTKKNYFHDFLQSFPKNNINPSYLTTQNSSSKQSNSIQNNKLTQTQHSLNSSTSKSSIKICSQLETHCLTHEKNSPFAQKKIIEGFGEISTQRKMAKPKKIIEIEKSSEKLKMEKNLHKHKKLNFKKVFCFNHPKKEGKFLKLTKDSYEKESFCPDCLNKLINQGFKIEDSERMMKTQIEGLIYDIKLIKPNLIAHKEKLELKKEDISRFYDNQLVKIQSFYHALSQRVEAEKLSIIRSFQNHKKRTMEIYQNYELELEKEKKDLYYLEEKLINSDACDEYETVTLKTQEKLISTRLNMNSRNKEFISIYKTSGLNEKKLLSIKKQLFPLFEVIQIPTSIVKSHITSEKETNLKNEAYFSFENNSKNENSLKFKNILEKVKKNQARNSELFMQEAKRDQKFEGFVKRMVKTKSLPSFHRDFKDLNKKDENFVNFIENKLNESQELSINALDQTGYQKTLLFYSPNFKEV